uniref:Uncharacterized protein n=1 Tax=Equus asinus TaxID=9793 RepID=A0A9L0JM73_EQUAS
MPSGKQHQGWGWRLRGACGGYLYCEGIPSNLSCTTGLQIPPSYTPGVCCLVPTLSSPPRPHSRPQGSLSPQDPQPHPSDELTQAEELLEQQLELSQALLEGQQGAWETHALVLKTQKLREQRRRHRESLRGDA